MVGVDKPAVMRPVGYAELEDLIHLPGPLTEDAVLKCLHARFSASHLYVSHYNLWSRQRIVTAVCGYCFHYNGQTFGIIKSCVRGTIKCRVYGWVGEPIKRLV